MDPKTIGRMKDLVREDFVNDIYNQLVGFLQVENTIEDTTYPQDYLTEGAVLVIYKSHTGEFSCELLTDMVANIEEKLLGEVEGLAECGPVKVVTTGGTYIITPPNHLPPDEDGWKLSSSSLEEEYYYSSLEELWEEIQPEEILEIC
jgi:hypothetical protein